MKTTAVAIFVTGILATGIAAAQPQTWSFSNCGQTGADGPAQGDCDTAYSGSTLDGTVTVSGGVQSWTVPETGVYTIETAGASGGDSNGGPNGDFVGGAGARVIGEFNLAAGETLRIIVGQEGTTPASNNDGPLGGGGGGSFVWRATGDELLIAGGGGGGAGDGFTTNADANGAPGTASDTGSLVTGLLPCVSLATPGEGWLSSNHTCGGLFSGGGAGWNSAGEGDFSTLCSTTPSDALNPLAGGTGGAGNEDDGETGPGGFGGGGGSAVECGSTGGGGGGGYTGGAGVGCQSADSCGAGGGGAGSFNAGTNPQGFDGDNEGHGFVTISLNAMAAPAEPAEPIPFLPAAGIFGLATLLSSMALLRLRRRPR